MATELPFDIILESDDNATPTTSVSLMLAEDERGEKAWTEGRLPPFAPQQAPSAVQYANKEPQSDLVWAQDDWRAGALQAVYNAANPARYAYADGVDSRWGNALTLGMKKNKTDFLIRNGGAEAGATTGWTAGTGVTATAPAAALRTGSYGFRLVLDGSRVSGDVLFSQSLVNPTVWPNAELLVTAAARRTVGASAGIVLRIIDDTGNNVSSAVTSSSYTVVTVTRTVAATATLTLQFILNNDESGTPHTFEIDDIHVVPTGGMAFGGATMYNGNFYAGIGRLICQWDETNDIWNAVYVDTGGAAKAVTSVVTYNGNVYVAFGGADHAYLYGATTSWTTSTLAGDAKYAHFFTVSRETLWKSRFDGTDSLHVYVNSSTNPINGGAWGTEATVGMTDKDITGLHSFGDTIYVGKEDGLYAYLRVYADGTSAALFENLTPEYMTQPNTTNFGPGWAWKGWLYMSGSQQSLFRVNHFEYDDLSSLIFSPKITNMINSGRILSIVGNVNQLFLVMSEGTTVRKWLCSLRLVDGKFLFHVLQSISTDDVEGVASLAISDDNTTPYLWGFAGVTKDSQTVFGGVRWQLPIYTPAPAFDATPAIAASGIFYSSLWDANMPDEAKAYIKFTAIVDPTTVDSNHTIAVAFDINNSGSWTTLGTISTASTAIQTLSFDGITAPETNAFGRNIRLRLTFTTNNTSSPVLLAYVLHADLRPRRVRVWAANVLLGEGVVMRNGLVDPEAKATKLSALRTLEAQEYPIVLKEDMDGVNSYASRRVHIRQGSVRRNPELSKVNGQEVWSFEMIEVDFT